MPLNYNDLFTLHAPLHPVDSNDIGEQWLALVTFMPTFDDPHAPLVDPQTLRLGHIPDIRSVYACVQYAEGRHCLLHCSHQGQLALNRTTNRNLDRRETVANIRLSMLSRDCAWRESQLFFAVPKPRTS